MTQRCEFDRAASQERLPRSNRPLPMPEQAIAPGLRVLVMGLGRFGGGIGVTRWLAKQGARVTVTDAAPAESLSESLAAIADLPIELHLGGHDPADLDHADLVIINPAVAKATSPFFAEVVRRGIAWTTEMNLFCERCPATVIGITGTYGKSTTCGMLAAALQAVVAAGNATYSRVHLGGNIGVSLLADSPAIRESDIVVLEMSNAQLEDLPRIAWRPHLAAITNLWPHHLDRHGSFTAYASAKLNIIGSSDRTQSVVFGEMDAQARVLLDHRLRQQGHDCRSAHEVSLRGSDLRLRVAGAHNARNAACVLTICEALRLPESPVREALENFPGLPHRFEWIRTVGGVDFINDSKSTSPSATIVALRSIDRPAVAIVGGQAKDVPLEELADVLVERCRAVVCAGQSGPAFAAAIHQAALRNGRAELVLEVAETMAEAVDRCRRLAKPGDVVLYSPGAPSFDAYGNFVQRGNHFRQVVCSF